MPLAFSAAARVGSTGPSLATVTSFGYLGLMAGPPIIGGLSDVVGLPEALGVVVAIAGVTALLAPFLRWGRRSVLGPRASGGRVTWLLCDYGEVLSLPQSADDRVGLEEAAGGGGHRFWDAYWAQRPGYDRADLERGRLLGRGRRPPPRS